MKYRRVAKKTSQVALIRSCLSTLENNKSEPHVVIFLAKLQGTSWPLKSEVIENGLARSPADQCELFVYVLEHELLLAVLQTCVANDSNVGWWEKSPATKRH